MWLTVISNFLQFGLLGWLGIFVSTYPEETAKHKKEILRWFLAGSVLIGIIASWQAYRQQRDSDVQIAKVNSELGAVNQKLADQGGVINTIRDQNIRFDSYLTNIRKAAHLPASGPVTEAQVQQIINKLPKASAISVTNATGSIKGNGNVTALGRGQTVNAPNGIGTIGGTLVNPQVNNYGPPPAHLTYTENVLTPLKDHGKKLLEVHVKTDRVIPAAVIGFLFSEPFTLSQEFFNAHTPHLKPASVEQLDENAPLQNNGVPIPNSMAIRVNLPAAFVPGQDLIVVVESERDIHTLQVAPLAR